MLTKVLVYAYCVGIFSSRRIQRRLVEDVGFRVLAAGNEPDFRTIADFRKRHLAALQAVFEQVLRLARELRTPRVGRVALDGSMVPPLSVVAGRPPASGRGESSGCRDSLSS